MNRNNEPDALTALLREAQAPGTARLDARGLRCPLPALKTDKALNRLPEGMRLLVETTDPMARIDIPHLCREKRHLPLGAAARSDEEHCFLIERGPTR